MKIVTIVNTIRWVSKISFIILFAIEKTTISDGFTAKENNVVKGLKITFLVVFIVASIIENRLIIKAKDKEIESLKKQLNDKT